MAKKILILLTIVMLASVVPVRSQEFAPVGTSVAQFLEIGIGGRATALGQAYTAMTDDAGSAFWNPAALVQINRNDLYLGYNRWVADIGIGGLSYGINLGNIGTFGLSVVYLMTDDMEVTTINQPNGTGEMFSISNYSFGISYARNLTDKLSIGLTLKSVREYYYDNGYTTWAVDVGTLYKTDFRGLTLGMSILNFGPEIQYNGSYIDYSDPKSYKNNDKRSFEKYSLPVNFRIGVAIDVVNLEANKVVTAVDMVHPNNNLETYNWGLEYSFQNMFFLRGGYRFNLDEGGLTLGTGVDFNWLAENNASFDYSYADRGVFSGIHRFSVGISF